jgi:hypothetical protein
LYITKGVPLCRRGMTERDLEGLGEGDIMSTSKLT